MPQPFTITDPATGKPLATFDNAGDLILGGAVVLGGTETPGAGAVTGGVGALQFQAGTPLAGFALQNATPAILTWTAPSDGAAHRVILVGFLNVGSTETGGQVNLSFTRPDGSGSNSAVVFAGAQGAGFHAPTATTFLVQGGSTVTLAQANALTGGVAIVWAELWGS